MLNIQLVHNAYTHVIDVAIGLFIIVFSILLQVGRDGYFSFRSYIYFPFYSMATLNWYSIVAPFWTPISVINGTGQINYEIHTDGTSELILSTVDSIINEEMQTDFHGKWLLIAKWDNVTHSRSVSYSVSTQMLYKSLRSLNEQVMYIDASHLSTAIATSIFHNMSMS